MEYKEMQEILKDLSKNFPGSFLNVYTNEFIVIPRTNIFFQFGKLQFKTRHND